MAEAYFSLNQARFVVPELLPGLSVPSMQTVAQWANAGVQGQRLKVVCIGLRKRVTTRKALREFLQGINKDIKLTN